MDSFDYVVVGGGTAGRTVTRGANWFQINGREEGVRESASVSYLHPVLTGLDPRPNLTVRTGVRAKRLLFDGRRGLGVEYLTSDLVRSTALTAQR